MLIDFKDKDFETKVKTEDVAVVQFSASWCSPCKALLPVMQKLSESDEFKKFKFFYADIDEDAINLASATSIRGVPTIVVFKKGIESARKVGGLPENEMRKFLSEHLI